MVCGRGLIALSSEAITKHSMPKFAADRKFIAGTLLIAGLVVVSLLLYPYFSVEYVAKQFDVFQVYYDRNPLIVMVSFVAVATSLIGAALPVTGVISLLSGALFGFWLGLLLSTLASTAGATIVFMWSRHLFRDGLSRRYERQFNMVDKGLETEGIYYLFSLRLLAIVPFFMVNLLCGLTKIPLRAYILVTLIAQTIILSVVIYAGDTLTGIKTSGDILSPRVLFALALIGLMPLALHRIMNGLRRKNYPAG